MDRIAMPMTAFSHHAIAEIQQARTLLGGIEGLLSILSKRPRLDFHKDTLEYLSECHNKIAANTGQIVLLYAEAVGVDIHERADLRLLADQIPTIPKERVPNGDKP